MDSHCIIIFMYQSSDGELEMVTLKGLCVHCLRHSLRANKILNPMFRRYCYSHSLFISAIEELVISLHILKYYDREIPFCVSVLVWIISLNSTFP